MSNHELVKPDSKMGIWRENWQTDPRYTKEIKFGRKFTAIDAHYQIENMTKFFGPIGNGWGFERTLTVQTHEAVRTIKNDNDIKHTLLLPHVLCDMKIWYKWQNGDALIEGAFQCVGCCELYSWSKEGAWHYDEDAYKKAETDALTKGISKLGFNADVFLGMFDDSKYVAHVRKKFEDIEKESANKPTSEKPPSGMEPRSESLNTLLESDVPGYWEPSQSAWKEAARLSKLNLEKTDADVDGWIGMADVLCEACGMGQGAARRHMEEQYGFGVGGTPVPAPYSKNLTLKCATMFITVDGLLKRWGTLEKEGKVEKKSSLKLLREIHIRLREGQAPDLISETKEFFEMIENEIDENPAGVLRHE